MVAPAPVIPPSRKSFKTMRRPNHGVYLDRDSLDMDPRALADCLNVRVKDGDVRNQNMGWERFPPQAEFPAASQISLDGNRALIIDQFFTRQGTQSLIFGTKKDLFLYNEGTGTVSYLTPIYSTGDASIVNGTMAVTGAGGTLWDTERDQYPVTSGFGVNAVSGMEISFTTNAQTDPTAVWYEIDVVTNDTTLTILTSYTEATRVNEPYTIRQTFTGDNFDIWSSAIFPNAQDPVHVPAIDEDLFYLTNGIQMLFWNGTTAQPEWFNPGFVSRGLVVFKQSLMAFFVIEGGETKPGAIRTSEITNPNNFATNGATEFVAADGVSDLLALIPLGDQIAAFYNRDISLIQFVGPPLFYISRVAIPGLGTASSGSIADFGDFLEFLSSDAAYRFDGVSLSEIGPQVFREWIRRAAPNRIDNAFVHIDEENGEVLWSVPLTIDGQDSDQAATLAIVEHYLEDVGSSLPVPMTIRDFPATASGFFSRVSSLRFSNLPNPNSFESVNFTWDDRIFQAGFPFNLFSDDAGLIFIFGTADQQGSSPTLNSFALLARVAVGDGRRKGLVQRVEPHTTTRGGSGAYKLGVDLHFADFPNGDTLRIVEGEFDMTHTALRHVAFRDSGRYLQIRLSTKLANEPWDVGGMGITVVPTGER